MKELLCVRLQSSFKLSYLLSKELCLCQAHCVGCKLKVIVRFGVCLALEGLMENCMLFNIFISKHSRKIQTCFLLFQMVFEEDREIVSGY